MQDGSTEIVVSSDAPMVYSQLSGTNKSFDDIPVPPSELPVALSEIRLDKDTRKELGLHLELNRYDMAILTRMVGSISQSIRFKQGVRQGSGPPWADRLPDELLEMDAANGRGLRADYFVMVAGYTKMRQATLFFRDAHMGPKSEVILQRAAIYLFRAYS